MADYSAKDAGNVSRGEEQVADIGVPTTKLEEIEEPGWNASRGFVNVFTKRQYTILTYKHGRPDRVQCVHCKLEFKGTVTRLKHHFTGEKAKSSRTKPGIGTRAATRDVQLCKKAPPHVVQTIFGEDLVKERRSTTTGRVATALFDLKNPPESHHRTTTTEEDEGGRNDVFDAERDLGNFHFSQGSTTPSGQPLNEIGTPQSPFLTPSSNRVMRRSLQTEIPNLYQEKYWKRADELWSMAAAVNGWSFNSMCHPKVQEAFNYSRSIPGYKLPSDHKLRGSCLDTNYQSVKEDAERVMFPKPWSKVTISCDGWGNVQGRPLVNIMLINRHGEMFRRALDASNKYKNAKWISTHIMEEIELLGPQKVLQFVTDNASANVLAGKMVQERYPHVIFGGCVAHGIDLFFEDMGKLPWVNDNFYKCRKVVKFVRNHQASHTMFMDEFSTGLNLLRPAATRFATNFIMIDRAYELRYCLKKMVVSQQWSVFCDRLKVKDATERAKLVTTIVLDDNFWDEIHDLILLMEPIFVLLRQVDAHKDFIGQVYWQSWECKETLKGFYESPNLRSKLVTPERCDVLILHFMRRWNMWTNIVQTTAMCLTPKYLFHQDRIDAYHRQHVKSQFKQYCQLYGAHILGNELKESVQDFVMGCVVEFSTILSGDGYYAKQEVIEAAKEFEKSPIRWWNFYGDGAPRLQKIALDILGQACTASACERNWSIYSHVQSKSRNRLKAEKAEKLVYIYHNSRLTDSSTRHEKRTMREFNRFYKSRGQQQVLQERHGREYGVERDPAKAWISDIPAGREVSEEEFKSDVVGKEGGSSSKTYVDDIGDADFENNQEKSTDVEDDLMCSDGEELICEEGKRKGKGKICDSDSDSSCDDESTPKTFGVEATYVKMLDSKFPTIHLPSVKLNRPDVHLDNKRLRSLVEIYSSPVVSQTQIMQEGIRLKKHKGSSLNPNHGRSVVDRDAQLGSFVEVAKNVNEPSVHQEDVTLSPTRVSLRNKPLVDYKLQLGVKRSGSDHE